MWKKYLFEINKFPRWEHLRITMEKNLWYQTTYYIKKKHRPSLKSSSVYLKSHKIEPKEVLQPVAN